MSDLFWKVQPNQDKNDFLWEFNYPPKGISDKMKAEWNYEKIKILDGTPYKNKNKYYRIVHLRRMAISAGAFLASMSIPLILGSMSEFSSRQTIGTAGFVAMYVSAMLSLTSAKKAIDKKPTKSVIDERKRRVKKDTIKGIKRLHRKWVKQGLVEKDNMPRCLEKKK